MYRKSGYLVVKAKNCHKYFVSYLKYWIVYLRRAVATLHFRIISFKSYGHVTPSEGSVIGNVRFPSRGNGSEGGVRNQENGNG